MRLHPTSLPLPLCQTNTYQASVRHAMRQDILHVRQTHERHSTATLLHPHLTHRQDV